MNQLKKKNNWSAYLYILPLMVLSFALIYYCIICTVGTSFTDWNGMSKEMNFVGLKNYTKMLHDKTFWTAVANNVIFFFGTVFISWLGDPRYALLSVIIVNIFQWMGFSMIIYYAGLMSLPDDVYEAARIDGAGFWRTTLSITFPMVKGTTNVLIILGIVGSLKTFDIVKLLTGGGPGRSSTVLNTYLYEKAFKDFNAGGAASIGVAILMIAVIMSFLQIKLGKED